MDSLDAVHKICELHPSLIWSEVRSALDSEVDELLDGSKSAKKHQESVQIAFDRILLWLKEANEYSVLLSYGDIASFVASHRRSCVWAILRGKDLKARMTLENTKETESWQK